MRLFIAINFDDAIKDNIFDTIQKLESHASRGNFTHKENLHITLVFLGEVPGERIGAVKQAMDSLKADSFRLVLKGLGCFKRNGGDIYWIGMEKNSSLTEIYNKLCSLLARAGFSIESREYKPHLTLGREVHMEESFYKRAFSDAIMPIDINVEKISLMKSERINGRLTYTEIYTKYLYS
jgi:2'-5' RNA ligase